MNFPVLVFIFGGRSVLMAKDDSVFRFATTAQLKRGFFSLPLKVIDYQLDEHVALRPPRIVRGVGGFLGYNVFLNRTVEIFIEFERRAISLDLRQVATRVADALLDDPTDVWGGGELSPDERANRVRNCNEKAALFELLS